MSGLAGMIERMRLAEIVRTWQAVGGTPSRRAKAELLAAALRGLAGAEVVPGVAYLQGELRQRQIGVGWAAVREVPDPASEPSVTVLELDAALARIGEQSGPGSQGERRRLLAELFGRATGDEQWFLQRLLVGELRQGALAGVMADAVARAAGVPLAEVRRALLLAGDLREVAVAALESGSSGLARFRLHVGRPLAPMLAQPASGVSAALARSGEAAIEEKLDGARVQVHRDGGDVAVFTRSLDDITSRVPELAEAALRLPVSSAVLDGEAIALRPDGRPEPFQVTASRFGSRTPTQIPLSWRVFDVLHLDGTDLLDQPGSERFAALAGAVPDELRIRRLVGGDDDAAQAFLAETLARGHEGVVVKSLATPYEAGRGGGWLKVKPSHTLDLVVLAAEWGHGRRQGWLSNLHLGAADPHGLVGEPGGFVMLGKTFKGLTDQLLTWQTERLLAIEAHRTDWVVHVRPELVVEIAFDGVQSSTRYPGGVALRFARVKRYRTDKSAGQADTIETVRAIHAGQQVAVGE
ncbi:MAG: ligase 1 [Cryptosporangiaceae bacterium]|nr:ligase 1 [Cryptosporangiaceae bacterium]